MVKKISVTDSTTGYGYFIVDEHKGSLRVWRATVHWASGWKYKENIGSARTMDDASTIIKSYSGGRHLQFH